MALRAAAVPPLLVQLLSLCPAPLAGAGARAAARVQLQQPQAEVSVSVGQTLTLRCAVSEHAGAGPVRWLKPSDGKNRTIYDQKSSFPRVTRAANGSNTDFTIHISDARPEDAGTYYCVKLRPGSEEQVYCSGPGTTVSVHERAPFPSVAVAAAALSILLLVLLVALCVYQRKRGGGSPGSPGLAPAACRRQETLPSPSASSSPLPDAETSPPPGQRAGGPDADVHYADLRHLPAAPRRARSPGAPGTEYASIRLAAR